jgi:hypothetical protein
MSGVGGVFALRVEASVGSNLTELVWLVSCTGPADEDPSPVRKKAMVEAEAILETGLAGRVGVPVDLPGCSLRFRREKTPDPRSGSGFRSQTCDVEKITSQSDHSKVLICSVCSCAWGCKRDHALGQEDLAIGQG